MGVFEFVRAHHPHLPEISSALDGTCRGDVTMSPIARDAGDRDLFAEVWSSSDRSIESWRASHVEDRCRWSASRRGAPACRKLVVGAELRHSCDLDI